MKRFSSIVLIVVILISCIQFSAAEPPSPAVSLTEVRHSSAENSERVDIFISKYDNYTIMRLDEPDRIVVDINGASAPGKQQVLNINSHFVNTVRYAQFDINIARVVIDAKETPGYTIEKTGNGLAVILSNAKKTEEGNEVKEEKSGQQEQKPAAAAPSKTVAISNSITLKYQDSGMTDTITLLLSSYKDYKVTRLTGPDRLVLDIPNIKTSINAQTVKIGGDQIQSIRYAKYGSSTARIVLDVNKQSSYKIEEKKGALTLHIEEPQYKNIRYHNNGDRVYVTLIGTKLTDGDEFIKKLYTGSYDKTGKKYTITFPTSQGNIGNGLLRINDEYLDYIEIKKDDTARTTSLIFSAKAKFTYLPFYRAEVSNTNITIIKPAPSGQKVVAIDAGHGGYTPGAIYGSVEEKALNLDIALRLNKYLEAKKVNTYMLREDDSYINNYERAYIANALGASLFISVHNNAMDDTGYSGTMTLYYPGSGGRLSGKTFAQLLQDRLLYRLKTKDRKIIARPNLIVLKATKMPAVIAEVAYLTNKTDRTNLLNASFRDKAALALSEGVLQALSKLK